MTFTAHLDRPLPRCFCRPQSVVNRQGTLFRSRFVDVLVEMQISMDEIARWHGEGWLSFDGANITEVADLDDPRVWELIVIRDIVRSGLGDAHVRRLIAQLPKPAAIDPGRLAYSYRFGWVEGVFPAEPDQDEFITEHLDSWLETCDEDRLRELQSRIAGLLDDADATGNQQAV